MSAAVAAGNMPDVTGGYLAFLRELPRYLEAASARDEPCSLIVVHLSNLNRINRAAGYPVGQRMSSAFAGKLRKMLRDDDWMAPLTADRFAIVLGRVKNAGHVMLAANRIVTIAAGLPVPDCNNLALEVRAGAAVFPEQGEQSDLLLRNAELALEAAARGKVDFALYEPEVVQVIASDWDLEADIRPGFANGEFEMFYQPKIEASTLLPCGAEALMRWCHPRHGYVPPDRFIALAENSDCIDALTSFALHGAARTAMAWGLEFQNLSVAVNLSPSTINRGNIISSVEQAAAIWGIGMERFTAEVTENGIIATGGAALRVLEDLRSAGVRVSIDDFGTGNSSLAYFKDLPADELKIDKSFVFAMLDNEANFRMVKTIIDLAHGFDLKVVAEGVENAECVERLKYLGCDVLQGYHFSRPMPEKDFLGYLESYRASKQGQ